MQIFWNEESYVLNINAAKFVITCSERAGGNASAGTRFVYVCYRLSFLTYILDYYHCTEHFNHCS
jgi:hypothetical protein